MTVLRQDEPVAPPAADEVTVATAISLMSPGTERARFLGQPTATVEFPHVPGYLGAGTTTSAAPGVPAGTRVAARGLRHQSVAIVAISHVHEIPAGVSFEDAAVWQLALTAMHGLALGQYQAGEAIAVIGTGLLGAITRRIAAARGSTACLAVAASTAKVWTTEAESCTTFLSSEKVAGLKEKFSLVIDVTGTPGGLETAVSAAGHGGCVVVLGSPRALLAPFPVAAVYERRLRVTGAHVDTLDPRGEIAFTAEFFEFLNSGRFTVRDLVTVCAVADAPVVYRRLVTDRSFVAAAFDWGAGTATQPAAPAPHHRSGAVAMRFALVGCGDVGFQDAGAVVAAAGVELVACFDPIEPLAHAVARHSGADPLPTFEQVLDRRDVDAVLIATPHHTHEELAVAAMGAGKHVLLEKPLSQDLASAVRVADAAARADTITGVLFPLRSDSRFLRAQSAIQEGMLGSPLGSSSAYLVDKPPSYFFGGYSHRSTSTWRLSKALSGGGFLIMNLIHHIDAVRTLLGAEANSVYAEILPSDVAPEVEDVVTVVVRFGEAIATFVGGASVVGLSTQTLSIWGRAGRVEVLPEASTASLREPGSTGRDRVTATGNPRATAISRFAQAAYDGAPPDVPVADALAVQAILEAAYLSAGSGTRIAPGELLPGDTP